MQKEVDAGSTMGMYSAANNEQRRPTSNSVRCAWVVEKTRSARAPRHACPSGAQGGRPSGRGTTDTPSPSSSLRAGAVMKRAPPSIHSVASLGARCSSARAAFTPSFALNWKLSVLRRGSGGSAASAASEEACRLRGQLRSACSSSRRAAQGPAGKLHGRKAGSGGPGGQCQAGCQAQASLHCPTHQPGLRIPNAQSLQTTRAPKDAAEAHVQARQLLQAADGVRQRVRFAQLGAHGGAQLQGAQRGAGRQAREAGGGQGAVA